MKFFAFDLGSSIPDILEFVGEKDEEYNDYRLNSSKYSIPKNTEPLAIGNSIDEVKRKIPEYFV